MEKEPRKRKWKKKNPFGPNLLKAVLILIGTGVLIGLGIRLLNHFAGTDSYPDMRKFFIYATGGPASAYLAGCIGQYSAYAKYRRITKKEVSKETFIRLQKEFWELTQKSGKKKNKLVDKNRTWGLKPEQNQNKEKKKE